MTGIPLKRGVGFTYEVVLWSQANANARQSSPTLAAADFLVSLDGAASQQLAALPTVITGLTGTILVTFSAGEATCDRLVLQCVDVAGAEWYGPSIVFELGVSQTDDLALAATALSNAVWTNARAVLLDNLSRLDATISSILTSIATSFARVNNVLRASILSLVQGDTWAEPLTLTPFAWAAGDKIWFTVKDVNTYQDSITDADSILQWLLTNGASASDGLTYINQVAAGANRTKGSLAVVSATTGVITLNLDEAISLLVPGTYVFDVKVFSSAGVVTSIGGGTLVVEPTITFSIT